MIASWLHYFIGMAQYVATKSKDPNHKVGCVIVDIDNNILSTGFNGFPRGVSDDLYRYHDQPFKLALVVHAEANAIAMAARKGHSLSGSIAIVTKAPCSHCAGLLVQAGIVACYYPIPLPDSSWIESQTMAELIFNESGVKVFNYE